MAEVWYANEIEDSDTPPPSPPGPGMYRHHLEHGEMWVAEADGGVVGFACSDVRERVRFLSDLFVRPDAQSAGIGRALLERAMPHDGKLRCTLSSKDPRAQALYARAGMAPRWPHFSLRVESAHLRPLEGVDVLVVPAGAGDAAALEDADARIGGRRRPVDLSHFAEQLAGVPVWLERGGRRVGYAFVQFAKPWSPERGVEAHVGPLGVDDPAHGPACALAAIAWAAARTPSVVIDVPGPHPALVPLLDVGFRIGYVELFMGEECADPRRYLGSGGDLF